MHTRGGEPSEDGHADEFWLPVDTSIRVDELYVIDVWPTQAMLVEGFEEGARSRRRRRRRHYPKY